MVSVTICSGAASMSDIHIERGVGVEEGKEGTGRDDVDGEGGEVGGGGMNRKGGRGKQFG
jgi:hypothetical protein